MATENGSDPTGGNEFITEALEISERSAADDGMGNDERGDGSGSTSQETPQTTEKPSTDDTQGTKDQSRDQQSSDAAKAGTRPQQGGASKSTPQSGGQDLVDGNGTVLARAGAERRLYERAQRSEELLRERDDRIARLERDLGDARQRFQGADNLNEQEMKFGVDLVQRMKTNPVEAAQWMIAALQQQGHSLQTILGQTTEGGPPDGLNLAAVDRLLEEKLAPFTRQQQEQTERAQREQAAQETVRQFYSNHPNAEVHQGAIAALLHKNPTLSLERAYYELRLYAAERGLDFSRPLNEQTTKQPAPRTDDGEIDIPAGVGGGSPETLHPSPVHVDDNWDSIVRESMKESGM
jgi:hypothetical protein